MTSAGRGRNFTTALAMMITMDMSHFFFFSFWARIRFSEGFFVTWGFGGKTSGNFSFCFSFRFQLLVFPRQPHQSLFGIHCCPR